MSTSLPWVHESVSLWLQANTERGNWTAETADLFEDYQVWCRENREPALSLTAFGRSLSAEGFEKYKNGVGHVARRGLRLLRK